MNFLCFLSARLCILLAASLLVALAVSCAGVQPKEIVLPEGRSLTLDQLVVHSDFEMPAQHRLLEELRAVRRDLTEQLSLPLSDEPVHVYLFDSEARYGAFTSSRFPEFPNRRAFFVKTDTRLAIYAHWGDRVAEDLRHEVTHGYLHAVVPAIPLWLDEGLAEHYEVARGARGANRAHIDLLSKQAVESGWRPNLIRLEQLNSAVDMTQGDYAEAWAWTNLLVETTPERRALLIDYLKTVRATSTAPSLVATIRQQIPAADDTLIAHILRLNTPATATNQTAPHPVSLR